jgi:hypothetical protein
VFPGHFTVFSVPIASTPPGLKPSLDFGREKAWAHGRARLGRLVDFFRHLRRQSNQCLSMSTEYPPDSYIASRSVHHLVAHKYRRIEPIVGRFNILAKMEYFVEKYCSPAAIDSIYLRFRRSNKRTLHCRRTAPHDDMRYGGFTVSEVSYIRYCSTINSSVARRPLPKDSSRAHEIA